MLWASLVSQKVKNLTQLKWLSSSSSSNAGDPALIPGLGRSPGEGNDNTLHYSCLENAMGQRNLAGYSLWGGKESDMTEQISVSVCLVALDWYSSSILENFWDFFFLRWGELKYHLYSFLIKNYTSLKVTCHLRFLQNIDYIILVVQYILEPI